MTENLYYLAVKKFLDVKNFHDVGVKSSVLHIFNCSSLSNNISFDHINEVHKQCFKMPFWNCISTNSSSDEENHPQSEKYIIAAIMHNDKS
jgi:hypothetical protein